MTYADVTTFSNTPADEEVHVDALVKANAARGVPTHAYWKYTEPGHITFAMVYVILGEAARQWQGIYADMERGEPLFIQARPDAVRKTRLNEHPLDVWRIRADAFLLVLAAFALYERHWFVALALVSLTLVLNYTITSAVVWRQIRSGKIAVIPSIVIRNLARFFLPTTLALLVATVLWR